MYPKSMDDKRILKALLDLQIAIGELQASMMDVDKAIRELMAVELDIKKEETEREKPAGSDQA